MNTRMIHMGIVAFSAIAAAVVVGATGRGQSTELSPEAHIACQDAAWPRIPADCLDGGEAHGVRFADAEIEAAEMEADAELEDLALRFRWAFGRFDDE